MKFTDVEIAGENISPNEYQDRSTPRGDPDFVMSRSELMDFADNPHKWIEGAHDEGTESTEWGDLMDVLLLIPTQFPSLYAVMPEKYPAKGMECPKCKTVTKAKSCKECGVPRVEKTFEKDWDNNATYCADWCDRQKVSGKRIIKMFTLQRAKRAVEVMEQNENAMSLIQCSKRQVMITALYHDDATGLVIPVKLMLDLVPNVSHPRWGKSLADLKTCACCNPPVLEKTIFNYHYDAQGFFYQHLYTLATKEDRPDWVIVAQENKPPYEVADPLPLLSTNFLDIGKSKISFALKYYARCLKDEKFPSYSVGQRAVIDGRYIAEPKDWMVMDAVDRPALPAIEKPATESERPDLIP